MKNRIVIAAAGAALLQAVFTPIAAADGNRDRYASSRYQYCDAVILGWYWGESVDEAKATIGRKLGWGNGRIIATNLVDARDQGGRCEFHETGFEYQDAEALAFLWDMGIDEAKAALAEKVSMGHRRLAEQVVAQAHAS